MSETKRPLDAGQLGNDLLLLQKQVESKNIENRNLLEKCDIQAKRIKFLKKEVEEYKLKESRLKDSEGKMASDFKTLKDSNRKLKEAVAELNKKIKEMETNGVSCSVITLGERVIANTGEELDLAGEGITDTEIKIIVGNRSLKNLILGDNQISDEGANLLCENLVNLTKLFLNKNEITDAGIEKISNLSNLRYLDLRYNKLTSVSAKHISSILTITQLSLSNNSFDDESTVDISKIQQLRYLDLSGNKITEKSVQNLLKLKLLTHLYLSSSKLKEEDIRDLVEGLKELSVGDFRFNGLKEEEKDALKKRKRETLQLFL